MARAMSQNLADQLREDLETERQKLLQEEAEIASLQERSERRRKTILHLEGALSYYKAEVSTDKDSDQKVVSSTKHMLVPETTQPIATRDEQKRKPMDMLRPEFQKFSNLADIVLSVLARQQKPLSSDELTQLIYAASPTEFRRAKNSLSAELRRGAAGPSPKWRKDGLNYVAIAKVSD